jgi:CRISPR-associated protein Csd2
MNNRYDFIYLFDTKDANPNGDPDAGNLPRVDAESGHGLVTDVCLKRKVRNFIQTIKPESQGQDAEDKGFDIYVREKAILNNQHARAYRKLAIDPKNAEQADRDKTRDWMCQNFFDIRGFGAVMTTEVNCGQVRGPVQIAFSRSIDPIVASEHSVTRCAVTTEKEAKAQSGDNRTMGRKFTIPYALYRTHGLINPFLADQTGFDDNDLELFFQALENAFQFDASAARPAGSMSPRGLLVFKHTGTDSNEDQRAKQAKLGCAPSHTLFERLKITTFEKEPAADGKPPREFADYAPRITFDGKPLDEFIKPGTSKELGNGITLIRRI